MAREILIKEAFKDRYGDTPFINDSTTATLISALATPINIRKITAFCIIGEPPITAVVHDIELFAENNGIARNGQIPDEWKENVGKLIGAIAYFLGYAKHTEKTLNCIPPTKNFKSGSNYI